MINAAIYDPETGRIIAFLRNATRAGNSIRGSNGRYVIGARQAGRIEIKWTEDTADPVFDLDGNVTGWSPATIEDMRESATDRDIGQISRAELIEYLDHLRDMARITDAQIDDRIALVTDLAKAKVYLARLTKETRDILRMMLWVLKDKL